MIIGYQSESLGEGESKVQGAKNVADHVIQLSTLVSILGSESELQTARFVDTISSRVTSVYLNT